MAVLSVILMTGYSLESTQTAGECELALRGPTISAVGKIPPVGDARSNDLTETGMISHELWGDERKFPPLAQILQKRGFRTSVEPEEYGDHLRVDESVESFRKHHVERIQQLCTLADQRNLRYSGWPIWAGRHTHSVFQ
jgi:hypothetical protein